jgi:hypothetical protein
MENESISAIYKSNEKIIGAMNFVAFMDIKIYMQDSLVMYSRNPIDCNIEDTYQSHNLDSLLKNRKEIAQRYFDSKNEEDKQQLIEMFKIYNKDIVNICGLNY